MWPQQSENNEPSRREKYICERNSLARFLRLRSWWAWGNLEKFKNTPRSMDRHISSETQRSNFHWVGELRCICLFVSFYTTIILLYNENKSENRCTHSEEYLICEVLASKSRRAQVWRWSWPRKTSVLTECFKSHVRCSKHSRSFERPLDCALSRCLGFFVLKMHRVVHVHDFSWGVHLHANLL